MELLLHPTVAFHAVQACLTPSILYRLNLPLEVPSLAILSNVLVLLGVPSVILKIVCVAAPAAIMAV